MYKLYHYPDLDDQIFDCLLASMAAIQAEDVHASLLFVGNLNGHHLEWLGSTTMNHHGVAAFDFATVSGCDQLVVGPTHACGGTLDILMTDVPDLVRVVIVAPIGNSDQSSLSAVISMAQAVPNLCVNRKVFQKHQVNWNTVCGAIQELPWHNIWLSDNPVEVLKEQLSCWLDIMYQTRLSVCETIRVQACFGLKQEAHLRCTCDGSWVNWEEFVHCQVRTKKPTRRLSVSLVTETGMFL